MRGIVCSLIESKVKVSVTDEKLEQTAKEYSALAVPIECDDDDSEGKYVETVVYLHQIRDSVHRAFKAGVDWASKDFEAEIERLNMHVIAGYKEGIAELEAEIKALSDEILAINYEAGHELFEINERAKILVDAIERIAKVDDESEPRHFKEILAAEALEKWKGSNE